MSATGAARRVEPWAWVALAIVASFQTWLIFSHALWFDEAQALLVARAPWADLHANLRYEGHPALWYLLLSMIDRLDGGRPLTLPLAEFIVAAGLWALIWLRSPFPSWAKLLLSLNYYVLFEYGVISRSYGLAALLILAAVAGRRSIWGWVFLALAANVAVHFTVAAAFVGGLMFLERRSYIGAALFAAGCVLAVATVYPSPADLHLASPMLAPLSVKLIINFHRISGLILPDLPLPPIGWGHLAPFPWSLFVALVALIAGPLMLRTWPARLAFLGLFGALWTIGVAVYPIWVRHVGALAIFLIAAAWMEAEREPQQPLPRLFVAWLVILAFSGVSAAGSALVMPFTRHPEIARWVREHHLEGRALGAWPGNYGVPLAALLDRPIINTQKGCAERFTRWNYDPQGKGSAEARILASGAQYVVSDEVLFAQPVARFPNALAGKALTIYDFGPPVRAAMACGR
jgi:hypothetical protein